MTVECSSILLLQYGLPKLPHTVDRRSENIEKQRRVGESSSYKIFSSGFISKIPDLCSSDFRVRDGWNCASNIFSVIVEQQKRTSVWNYGTRTEELRDHPKLNLIFLELLNYKNGLLLKLLVSVVDLSKLENIKIKFSSKYSHISFSLSLISLVRLLQRRFDFVPKEIKCLCGHAHKSNRYLIFSLSDCWA